MNRPAAKAGQRRRLAIVATHPIQYYAPWFAHLHRHLNAEVRVFYLWDFGVTRQRDPDFGHELLWDVDLLTGYDFKFVPNRAQNPGTHHFFGLRNPALVDALIDWAPDVVLLFGYRYWSHLRLMSSRRLAHLPFIFRGDSHLLAERKHPLARWWKRRVLRRVFRRFSAFLPVGHANAAYFTQHGVGPEQLYFAPHAIDQERFAASTPQQGTAWKRLLAIPDHHHVVLFVGKFEVKKQPLELMRAFRRARIPHATLVLVGAGALEKKLRRAAIGCADIRLVPFQNQGQMPTVYAAADLVVLPSEGPGETWGIAISEALGAGKAVLVSSHVGCYPDLVKPGRNGLVFPAGDFAALTRNLREALRDSQRLKRWGEESRRLSAFYSYRQTTAGLRSALEGIWKKEQSR